MTKLITRLSTTGILIYPLVVYLGLNYLESRYLSFYIGALLVLRVISGSTFPFGHNKDDNTRYLLLVGSLMLGIIGYTVFSNQAGGLKLYPVVISFSLLVCFAYSLLYPPTVIERIARITEPDLPVAGVRYTRNITWIWCGFFLLNGLVALYTSLYTSTRIWTLYNGLISYLLAGCLLGGEYLYRYFFLKKVRSG